MPAYLDTADRIDRMVATIEPRLRRRFRQTLDKLRSTWRVTEIELLLSVGRIEQALVRANVLALAVQDEWRRAFVAAGDATAGFLGERAGVTVSFDVANSRAVQAINNNRLRLIREITEDQRLAFREALSEGVRRGMNPRATARLFRDSLGLTEKQMQAVSRYRTLLQVGSREALERQLRDRRFDPTVRRSIRNGQPLTRSQVETMVARYRERFVDYRATMIARTEGLAAAHAGTEQLYAQAIQDGTLDPGDLTRKWNTRLDGKERPSHHAMNGQLRPMGDAFLSGDGNLLRFPGDPNAPAEDRIHCRCAVSTRFTVDAARLAPAAVA